MTARALAFVIWATVAATAVLWVLRLFVSAPSAPAYAVPVSGPVGTGDLSRLLGRDATPALAQQEIEPGDSDRFKLLGVVAPKQGTPAAASEGFAVISVGDKPPRTYRVGAPVDGDLVLQTVSARGAQLGPSGSPATVALTLPPPTEAATGTLPDAMAPAPSMGATMSPPIRPMRQAGQRGIIQPPMQPQQLPPQQPDQPPPEERPATE